MRKKILAANWKMNLLRDEAVQLYKEIATFSDSRDILVFSPSLYICELSLFRGPKVGAQNFHFESQGAFTGEISLNQISSCGATYVLVGHSERRQLFNESNDFLKLKVDAAIDKGFKVIFCCGEPLEIRENGKHIEYVINQLKASLFHVDEMQLQSVAIAYEPIWAIGTGLTASSKQAEEMHLEIRKSISETYNYEVADSISILYGGSCNEKNASELFACPNVDGGLIGGASLKSSSFKEIANALYGLY